MDHVEKKYKSFEAVLVSILDLARLIQYTVALHDEPELCILYEETIRENVRTVEMKNQERNIE